MPEYNPRTPDPRESRGRSDTSGLLRAIGLAGIAFGAYKGGGFILRNAPKHALNDLTARISRTAIKAIDAMERNPTFAFLNKAFLRHPTTSNPTFNRLMSEVDARSFGLIQELETISKLEGAGPNFLDAFKKRLLVEYDFKIPQLHKDGHRRMTLGDLFRTARGTTGQFASSPILKGGGASIPALSRKLGMKQSELLGLRLDPYLWLNQKDRVYNLHNLNVFGRAFNALQDIRPGGLPLFRLFPNNKAKKYGAALFESELDDAGNISNPIIRMLTGKDTGQLAVVGGNAWYRADKSKNFSLLDNLPDLQLTTDFRSGEMFARSMMDNKSFDRAFFGSAGKGLKGMLGLGGHYMPKMGRGPLHTLAHMENETLIPGPIKRLLKKIDPTGIIGSGSGRAAVPFAQPTGFSPRIAARGAITDLGGEYQQKLFLRRGGAGGVLDWLNLQTSRPLYLFNRLGIGIRPGKNFINTLAKVSAIATTAYMAKEGVEYLDWLAFNVPSDILREGAGLVQETRQRALDITGVRKTIGAVESETPGVVNSPLSQALRFGGLVLGGAAAGKLLGGPKFMSKLLNRAPSSFSHIISGAIKSQAMQGATNPLGAFTGSLVGAFAGGAAGLLQYGDLSKSPQEIAQERSGSRQTEYRASAGWVLGRDPFSGGRIRYFKPSALQSFGTAYSDVGIYGSEGNKWKYGSWLPTPSNWFGLRRLLNPYYAENRNRSSRPYPITSGHFHELPIFGPLASSTIGSILKPEMTYGQLGGGGIGTSGGGLGTLAGMNAGVGGGGTQGPGGPMLGYGNAVSPRAATQVAGRMLRNFEEYIGLRGFQSQFLRSLVLGEESTMLNVPVLAQSGEMTSVGRRYFGTEPGGLLGGTELLRRFLIRPTQQPQVNPIPNSLPRWLPGRHSMFERDRDYYADLSVGDPYAAVPAGEGRLPGPGRNVLYPLHGGAAYSVVDAFLVLSDVAPFTQGYTIMKGEVERLIDKGQLPPEWVERYAVAVEQTERRANFRVFHSNKSYKNMTVTVDEVLSATTFTTRERPGVVYNLGGTMMDYSEPMKLLSQRISSGMDPDAARMSVERDRAKLRNALVAREGQQISVRMLGYGSGRAQVEIPSLQGMISDMGIEEESALYDQGLLGRAYTGAGKLVGELGFGIGAVAGLFGRGAKFGGPATSAIASAAVGGIIGGWLENKFTGDFTAREHYERFQKYGSAYADWNRPYSSFIRPWAHSAASTLFDYTPPHRAEQYRMEEYFDNLKYVKYAALEKVASSSGDSQAAYRFTQLRDQTLAAQDYANLTAHSPGLAQALPANERQYFRQFAAESDPEEQMKILDAVPDYMKSIYLSIWNNELPEGEALKDELGAAYAEHVSPMLEQGAAQRVSGYFSDHYLPPASWGGWHPSASIEDVKYKTIQFSGGSPHDHGLYSSQGAKISAFQPFIVDASDELSDQMDSITLLGSKRTAMRLMEGNDPNFRMSWAPAFGQSAAGGSVYITENDSDRYQQYIENHARGEVGIY